MRSRNIGISGNRLKWQQIAPRCYIAFRIYEFNQLNSEQAVTTD